jgi:hypothetical protein
MIYLVMESQSDWTFNGEYSVETETKAPIRGFATPDEAGDYIASQNSMCMSVVEIPFGPVEENER